MSAPDKKYPGTLGEWDIEIASLPTYELERYREALYMLRGWEGFHGAFKFTCMFVLEAIDPVRAGQKESKTMKRYAQIKISITTMDGELLDSFPVTHWRSVPDSGQGWEPDEFEYVGSAASENILAERIRDYVEIAPPKEAK